MQPNARLFGIFSMFFLNNLPDWHSVDSPGQTPLLLTSPSTPQVRILSSSSFQFRQPGKPSIQTECVFEFTLIKQSIIYLSIFLYAPFIGPYNHNFKSGPSVINPVPGVFPLVISRTLSCPRFHLQWGGKSGEPSISSSLHLLLPSTASNTQRRQYQVWCLNGDTSVAATLLNVIRTFGTNFFITKTFSHLWDMKRFKWSFNV